MNVGRNIIANFVGRIWIALMSFCFVPLYVRYLGIESYGLVGIFNSLMSFLIFLEFGMAQTLVRESARSKVSSDDLKFFQKLINSFEIVYGCIAVIFVFVLWFISDLLASGWLESKLINQDTISVAIQIMAIVAATRWVSGSYRSALIGRQRQVWLNGFDVVFSTVRGGGVIVVLVWVSNTVEAFFIYQGSVSVIEFVMLRWQVRSEISLSPVGFPVFSLQAIQNVWRFTGGVSVVTLLGSGISQLDKLLLPGLVSLEAFGIYMLANSIGRTIRQLVMPIVTAYRPVFAQLVYENNEIKLRKAYHAATQFTVLAVVPASVVLSMYAKPLVFYWVGDALIASLASPIVSMVAIGSALNGLVNMPYSIQLAYGDVNIAIKLNLLAFIIFVPVFYFGVVHFGILAAGFVWMFLNLMYIVFNLSITHRRFLIGSSNPWYCVDVIPATIVVVIVTMLTRFFMPQDSSVWFIVFVLISGLSAFFAAVIVLPEIRNYAMKHLINPFIGKFYG
jgi:O-antigen/teichoic acid export membrane protein